MSVVIFNNMFDDFLISTPLSNPVVQHYLRRAKYIDQSRAGGISAITGSSVVNILVFDLRVQLQRSTYQRKSLLFICKREISGFSSPLSSLGRLFQVTVPL